MIIEKNIFNLVGVIFILCSLLLSACHITYKVRNQHSEVESILHTSCGKITIELVGRGNSKFVIKQTFDLSEKVIVNMDSIHVFYNNRPIRVKHNLINEEKSQMQIELNENDLWESSFQFDKGVFEGDTIAVFGSAYVQCREQVISLDTLYFSFTNRLRIYGVNDF
jgi:hypothetical protein